MVCDWCKGSNSKLGQVRDQHLRDQTTATVVQCSRERLAVGESSSQRQDLQQVREMSANLQFALSWAGVPEGDQEKWFKTKVSDDMLVLWALRGKARWIELGTAAMTLL